ncbi:MAG: nuclear transport factor 2 family protein, partial [Pseudonocardiaceae bacterium]
MDGERDVGPIAEGDLVAGRWTGVGVTPDGEHMHFFGNDILRARDGRFVEHWVASS